jgi:hypothetical protein
VAAIFADGWTLYALVKGNVDSVCLLINDTRQTADYVRDCERRAAGDGG